MTVAVPEVPTFIEEGEVTVIVKSGGVPNVKDDNVVCTRAPLDAVIVTV